MQSQGHSLATLESVTGGLLAHALTSVPGSGYLLGGAISYDRNIKEQFGVSAATIDRHGVVSGPVAEEMARAAARWFGACHGVGVTGVAGPDPESDGSSPGTAFAAVWSQGAGGLVVPISVGAGKDRAEIMQEIGKQTLGTLVQYVHRPPEPCQ
jgi:PncC family amidohydrolase